MAKNRNLIRNFSYNFKLKGRPSFFIGSYILLGSYLIQMTIDGFTTVDSPFSFLTVNLFEFFIFLITFLVILFSLLALFFGNRRYQRKIGNKIWNRKSKKSLLILVALILALYNIEVLLLRSGQEQFLIPTFLMGYGFILMLLNFEKSKEIYLLSMVSIGIGFLPLLYPNYGFNSLLILGVSHIVFGLANNKK